MKTPEIYVGQKMDASGVLHFIVFTVVDNTIMNPCTLNICLYFPAAAPGSSSALHSGDQLQGPHSAHLC